MRMQPQGLLVDYQHHCCCLWWSLSVALEGAGLALALAHSVPNSFPTLAETMPINSFGCQKCTDVLSKFCA
jgi:hypothetical protein